MRGRDHIWRIVKFKGDVTLYAKCKCGYYYPCSKSKRLEDGSWSAQQEIVFIHNYCPECGAKKKWWDETILRLDRYRWEKS